MFSDDTIAAVATAVGEGGIGIIRISGRQSQSIAAKIFRPKSAKRLFEQKSHTVVYGHIIEPLTEEVVDEVLLIVMRAPHSYTKEDVVEIHCHGGVLPLKRILGLMLSSGARLAEAGEFTKRAFLNGRLDLSQAEAVIDVIRAKTDAALKMAVGHLEGSLSKKVNEFRQQILAMIAHLEAAIDYPEEDIEELAASDVDKTVRKLIDEIDGLLATARTGRILREGLKTAIIGKPNVGKSSLLNTLLGEKRAIVTDVPGTTRDIIEEYVNIGGIPLVLVDTAGIRETADIVEQIGVEKARQVMNQADLILMLLDNSDKLSKDDRQVLASLQHSNVIVIINKTDLEPVLEVDELSSLAKGRPIIKISVLDGSGLNDLTEAIVSMVYSGRVITGENAFISNVRHSDLLQQAKNSLAETLITIGDNMPPDCIVVDLRTAWEKLGMINGDTVSEDIIDEIFSRFCLGK